MTNYTSPIETTFELQRKSLEQGQEVIEQGLDLQQRFSESVIGSLENQEALQRRIVELHRDTVHRTLDAVEGLPGADIAVEDLRESLDGGYDEVLDGHEEAFDTVSDELESGVDSYDDLTADLLDSIEEQLDLLVKAHEELEEQSIEATEGFTGQVEELQDQVEGVQEQIEQVSEEAAEAVENAEA